MVRMATVPATRQPTVNAARLTAPDVITMRLMREHSGNARMIPTDSLMGNMNRPTVQGWPGSRVATLETLFDFWINNVPDPDTARARDITFGEKMRQQPDVHACMRLRELTVASMPAKVVPSNVQGIDRAAAQEVADYVNDVLNDLNNRCDLYRQMQQAVLLGGQGIEFVWAPDGEGHSRPVEFYPVHKSRFVFDRLGNLGLLTRQAPVWGEYVARALERQPVSVPGGNGASVFPVAPGKFVYHKYMSEGGPWEMPAFEGFVYWGRGEDCHLYIPVTFDQFALRFRMKWLERFGTPLTLIYYPDSEGLRSEVANIAKSLREENVVTIPRPPAGGVNDYYQIDYKEPPSGGLDAFTNFSDLWTKPRVEKILLGGANLMETGPTGSYASTVNQRDAGAQMIFRWDAVNIDTTLDTQLVPYICQARWPGMSRKYYPKHKIAPEIEKDRKAELEILEAASRLVPIREADVYDVIGKDRPKDDEPSVKSGGGESPFEGFPGAMPPLTPDGEKAGAEMLKDAKIGGGAANQEIRSPIGAEVK